MCYKQKRTFPTRNSTKFSENCYFSTFFRTPKSSTTFGHSPVNTYMLKTPTKSGLHLAVENSRTLDVQNFLSLTSIYHFSSHYTSRGEFFIFIENIVTQLTIVIVNDDSVVTLSNGDYFWKINEFLSMESLPLNSSVITTFVLMYELFKFDHILYFCSIR